MSSEKMVNDEKSNNFEGMPTPFVNSPFIIKEHEMTKLRPTNYFTEKQHWCRTFKIGKGLDSQLIFPESRHQGTDGERGNGNV